MFLIEERLHLGTSCNISAASFWGMCLKHYFAGAVMLPCLVVTCLFSLGAASWFVLSSR
jgi:hypothetical protein